MTGLFDTLHQVHGSTDLFKCLAGMLHRFIGCLLGPGVGGYDLGIPGFQGAQGQAADGGFRVCTRNHVGNHTDGLGVCPDPERLAFFDHSAGFGIAHVIERTQSFVLDFIYLVFGITDAGFIHGQMAQLVANIIFHEFPSHGFNHLVDFFLRPEFNLFKGLSRPYIQFLNIVFHDSTSSD